MNLLELLNIQPQTVTSQQVIITMDVTAAVKQPYGIVHGGINAVLAETAASLGANQWLTDHNRDQIAVGINITTQHLIAVSGGQLKTIAAPIKIGRRIQTWRADVYCQKKLTSTSTVTLMNQQRKND